MKYISPSLVCIAITTLLISTASQSTHAVPTGFLPPELIKSAHSTYPTKALSDESGEQNTDEGLVRVEFIVDQHGKPQHPVVTLSTNDRFNDEAIKSIKRYRYNPASVNNQPVESRMSESILFRYRIQDSRDQRGGASRFSSVRKGGLPDGFRSFYDRFSKEIERSRPSKSTTEELLSRMSKIKHQSFYSLAYYYLGLYKFAEKFGDEALKIDSLQKLIWVDAQVTANHQILDEKLEPAIKATLLKSLIETGQFAQAKASYKQFSKQDTSLEIAFKEYIDRIETLKTSNDVTYREVSILPHGDVTTPLLKKAFVVELVEGNIQTLRLRCDTRFVEFQYKFDKQIELPKAWGDCNMQISGKPGSVANLLQQ